MSLYLCVDCGGSKTSAVICNKDGKIVGRALAGPSNFAYIGMDAFRLAVAAAVSNALKTCFSPPSIDAVHLPTADGKTYFASVWMGISGVDAPSAIASVSRAMSDLFSVPEGPRLSISNDTNLLAAPLRLHKDAKYAITVIAGTGSNVASFKGGEDGSIQEIGRTGGWGWILGDEGGGFNVGREAIRQIVAKGDRDWLNPDFPEPPSILTTKIMEKFGAQTPLDLLVLVHLPEPSIESVSPNAPQFLSSPREKRLSSLAPIVFECAFELGDALALKVLTICSSGLVDQVITLVVPSPIQSGFVKGVQNAVKADETVICFGGSLAGVEKYRNLILEELKRRGHVFKYVELIDDIAGIGAISMAATAK